MLCTEGTRSGQRPAPGRHERKVPLFSFLFHWVFVREALDDQNISLPTCPISVNINISTIIVTPQKVGRIIKGLGISKATGPDCIPAIVPKTCLPELSPVLSNLSNICLSKLVFSSFCELASVLPDFKGFGMKSDPSKCQPISLLSIRSKVFERLFNEQVITFLEDHNVVIHPEHQFNHCRSTDDVLSLITEHLNQALDYSGEATLLALDISKTFDRLS